MEIVNVSGAKIEVVPLTKAQIRELKEYGFSYFACRPTLEQAQDAMDAAFKFALPGDAVEALDNLPVSESIKVWRAILSETYGGGEDVGNSQGTSDGGSTNSESNIAGSVVPETKTQASV